MYMGSFLPWKDRRPILHKQQSINLLLISSSYTTGLLISIKYVFTKSLWQAHSEGICANEGPDSKTKRDCTVQGRTFASLDQSQWTVTMQSSNPLGRTEVTSREEIFCLCQLKDGIVAELLENKILGVKPLRRLGNGSAILITTYQIQLTRVTHLICVTFMIFRENT